MKPHEIPCYDLSAACSGYLYALQAAFDFIHVRGDGKVLVITTEVLSRVVNSADFDTAILFGDAATATIVYGPSCRDRMSARLHRPVTSAKGEDGHVLRVPLPGQGSLTLDGMALFGEAVRSMVKALEMACTEAHIDLSDLDVVVPHQANGRIIDVFRAVVEFPQERVLNCIREIGNTSSSSIPVALSMLDGGSRNRRIGLCAFGGGFTSGAAILEEPDCSRSAPGRAGKAGIGADRI
jgi:2-oxoisovalerate dehydrogenase E1 component